MKFWKIILEVSSGTSTCIVDKTIDFDTQVKIGEGTLFLRQGNSSSLMSIQPDKIICNKNCQHLIQQIIGPNTKVTYFDN